ncbi:VCBS repeat-containing protein [Muricauda sp. 2012CJ35-5]|uniref:VCBS repeat-containing protein n=1 Tax=Flagellimonas spongiicola TaxID=2942208 RepID=A0ABT0PM11_9FLAO|nr:VCBS repeat-containing protein [Allomuricauda spongiicola]MCL6272434.1 VCBS repeat-containing protein [Allomuricauda spongiicola]
MSKAYTSLLIALLALSCVSEKKEDSVNEESVMDSSTKKIFQKLESSKTGIDFNNRLTHDVATMENLFDYDYFYNGAGVGVEDLNNDGLLDLVFCGNQVANKIYINTGNFTFEDVTDSSGINSGKNWSNGVTFADVNNDGWMDIYFSQGGPKNRIERKNLLFINQKDGTFTEQAEEMGLADQGISTQSAFFDFDKDGDLDCMVMNENELYGFDPISLQRYLDSNPESIYYNSSHLYRNDGGKFVDITRSAGLEKPIFGLGLSVSDINNDGWLDIYLASDYYLPDVMYINNKNGTFSDQIKKTTNQISFYGMGLDIADIDNDNLQDIFVLDMAANDHVRSKTLMASMSTSRFDYLVNKREFQHQYMYNSLQQNIGGLKFNNISQLSGVANTDWSWSVLMNDFDLDGQKEIHITNGYRRYALDNDLQRRVFEARQKYGNNVPLDVKQSLYESMPSERLPNILYKQSSKLQFKNVSTEWGLDDFSFSNGAISADLDNDGDLDLVVNNMDDNAFVYRNTTIEEGNANYLKIIPKGNSSEVFAKIYIHVDGKPQMMEVKRVRGYRSSQENNALFGIGNASKIDSIQVVWASGKIEKKFDVAANSTLEFHENDAKSTNNQVISNNLFQKLTTSAYGLDYTHQENPFDDFEKEILLPYKQSNLGPIVSQGDINNDGLMDIHVGGAAGQPGAVFIQNTTGFTKLASPALVADAAYEDMESLFFDFDGDKDQDLYIVSGGNEFAEFSSYHTDRIYINDGRGNLTRMESDALGKYPKNGKSVVFLDFDKDGDNDLLIGNRVSPGMYPNHQPSTLFENRNGELIDVTDAVVPDLADFGIINDIQLTDVNNDGLDDFIAVGEWTGIGVFINKNGRFENMAADDPVLQQKGWWFSVNETDVNNDGLKDYILGNAGLNIKFKASKEKPFKIFAADFDENGTNDIVLSKKYNGTYVPVRGRECSSQQMPFIKDKFGTYNEFANATLVDIYGEKLESSYERSVTEFNSILLINNGNDAFEKHILPTEVQAFPLLDCVFIDINKDGFEDVITAGNIYETEVETPRLDAISGLILISNGKDGYFPMSQHESGLYLEGNVKSLELIEGPNSTYLINTTNNGPLGIHKISPSY